MQSYNNAIKQTKEILMIAFKFERLNGQDKF